MKHTKKELKEAADLLREWIKPGDTIYSVIDQVSSSGMSRHIQLFCIRISKESGKPYIQRITYSAAVLLDYKQLNAPGHQDCIRISGCGMDMAWHTVSQLSYALFGDEQLLKSEIL